MYVITVMYHHDNNVYVKVAYDNFDNKRRYDMAWRKWLRIR